MIDLANGQLDRYELKERIGTGGMARVYKAWDTSLERLVAIKILHEHLADDPTFKERFEREAKFIASFNHPNIVQVYDFNVIYRDGLPVCYMVMSYIPGQTMRDMLEEANMQGKRLPLTRVRELVEDVTQALGYAHMRGMVHRDVKPGNILLNEHGRAILTDFGIARIVQSNRLTADGVSTGTPIYMSPEQANGQGGDMRSDLYSLGIIVYELLASRPPFVDDTSLAVMLKHLNTTPPLVSEFIKSHQFDAFLSKALAKKPDDRFQTADEFLKAFRTTFEIPDFEKTTIVPGIASVPTPRTTTLMTSVFQTISERAKENPRISAAIVVALLGAAALVILLVINSNAVKNAQAPEPTVAATTVAAVPSMTDAHYFTSTFDSSDANNLYWPTVSTAFLSRSFTDGHYQIRNMQPQTAATSLFGTTYQYTNFAIKMVARLESDSKPASGYGIVFRYKDEDNYNVFAVDGEGRYSIWVRLEGQWQELRNQTDGNWTADDVIKPLGSDNELLLSVLVNRFTGYVNGKLVVQVTDSSLPKGGIGIYLATANTDDGEATVSVDSYAVAASVAAMTGS